MRKWLSNQLEPSRLRATIVAVLALAASLGLVTTADVPGWVDAVLPVAAIILPTVQHLLVRPVVTPTAKVQAAIEAAPIAPAAKGNLEAQLVTGEAPVPLAA